MVETERYQALLEVSKSIAAHTSLHALLPDLKSCLEKLVHFDVLTLVLYHEERQTTRLHVLATNLPIRKVGVEYSIADTPAGVVLETGKLLYVSNVPQERRFPKIRELLIEYGCNSFCTVPLNTARRCVGFLTFGSTRLDAYTPGDLDFIEQAGMQVAVAVENALNYEKAVTLQTALAKERDRLKLLLEVNNALVSELGLRELFQAIARQLRKEFGNEYVSLALMDADIEELRIFAIDFPDGRGILRENAVLPREHSPAGRAITSRQPEVFRGDEFHAVSEQAAHLLQSEGICSFCSLPLICRGSVVGALSLGSRRCDAFSEEDVDLLWRVAGQVAIAVDNSVNYQQIQMLKDKLAEEKLYLEDEIRTEYHFEEIIGKSAALRRVLQQVETVAPTGSTVLIEGETGTGKELIARAIHNLSTRAKSTFVKLNCAAIPTGLVESELLGHERGAFTGAISQKLGRFELAHRGTLFLDEIAELPLETQPKLLRLLQEKEFERIGGTRTIQADVRLVAATNRNLQEMVDSREFRADLFYRLNVFPITIPPLRERTEDIALLVNYFAQLFARRMNKNITSIAAESMRALARYSWPGNIRELQNLMERAVILNSGSTLRVNPAELRAAAQTKQMSTTLDDVERDAIVKALRSTNWVVGGANGAAARLGMKRTTLQSRMEKLGIHREG